MPSGGERDVPALGPAPAPVPGQGQHCSGSCGDAVGLQNPLQLQRGSAGDVSATGTNTSSFNVIRVWLSNRPKGIWDLNQVLICLALERMPAWFR